jgi:AhpC/TSA family
MRSIALAALALAAGATSGDIRDIDGRMLTPMSPSGRANVLLFVMTDCPVSNAYAPEIQRVCREYKSRGVACSLIYADVDLDVRGARHHLDQYGYRGIPAAIDATRAVATAAGASMTPTAVVVDRAGGVRYRGRIDDFYVALGRTRRTVTQHYLADALEAVLAGGPVRVPETPPIGCHIVPANMLQRLRASSHASH